MQITNELIYIHWDGPFSLKQVEQFTAGTDFGIYQIYGDHVVYGRDVLLYIGINYEREFSRRIPEHSWALAKNLGTVRVYRGRLAGDVTPTDQFWNKQIKLAERLLIYAHYPAHNTDKDFGRDPAIQNIHVVNLGSYGSLLPEVSGTRWAETLPPPTNYHVFDTRDTRQEAPTKP